MSVVSLSDPGQLVPRGTTQAFGARAKVMNLAANPEAARQYFETVGFETREYGKGWNFVYRKRGSTDPWQPLDPRGLDPGDFTDIIADTLIGIGAGVASGLAATASVFSGPGAVAAGAVAGGATSAALESARQGLGSVFDIPNNVDVGGIIGAGVAGALPEPTLAIGGQILRKVGSAAQPVVKATGNLASQLTSKFIGVRSVGSMSSGEVMMEAHKMTQSGRVALLTSKRAGHLIHRIFKILDRPNSIPQVQKANAAIADAAGKQVTADIALGMKVIEDRTLKQTGTRVVAKTQQARTVTEATTERTVTGKGTAAAERKGSVTNMLSEDKEAKAYHTISEGSTESSRTAAQDIRSERTATTVKEVEEPVYAPISAENQREFGASFGSIAEESAALLDHLRRTTGYTGPWSETPVDVAWRIKQILQDITYGRGVRLTDKPSDIYSGVVREAASLIRRSIELRMEAHVPGFRKTMKEAELVTRSFADWRAALRVGDTSAEAQRARTEFVRRVYGEGQTHYLDVLNDLDRLFSGSKRGRLVNMAQDVIKQANVGRAVGAQGLGEVNPLFTAAGKFRSLSAIPVAGALFAGNIPMAAFGAAMGSPRLMMKYGVGAGKALNQTALDMAVRLSRAHLGRGSRIISEGVLSTAQVGVLRDALASEGGGTKAVARQDQARRRRVFVGG